jgi:hypothetical protein
VSDCSFPWLPRLNHPRACCGQWDAGASFPNLTRSVRAGSSARNRASTLKSELLRRVVSVSSCAVGFCSACPGFAVDVLRSRDLLAEAEWLSPTRVRLQYSTPKRYNNSRPELLFGDAWCGYLPHRVCVDALRGRSASARCDRLLDRGCGEFLTCLASPRDVQIRASGRLPTLRLGPGSSTSPRRSAASSFRVGRTPSSSQAVPCMRDSALADCIRKRQRVGVAPPAAAGAQVAPAPAPAPVAAAVPVAIVP